MLSQSADYALRTAVFLAMNQGKLMTNEQISEVTKVPSPYLAKIIQALTRSDIVRSQRGVGGGTRLARSPGDITVLQVVSAVDPLRRINYCPLGLDAHGTNLCPMHEKLDEAAAAVEAVFASSTIEDLVRAKSSSVPMCGGSLKETRV